MGIEAELGVGLGAECAVDSGDWSGVEWGVGLIWIAVLGCE